MVEHVYAPPDTFVVPVKRFSHINIDNVCPLHPSSGFTYLTIVDRTPLWHEAIHVSGITAITCAKAFVGVWISRFGMSLDMTSDRGLNSHLRLQTTQPTSGGAVTADNSCCANCVEPSAPTKGGPIYRFLGMPAMRTTGLLALLLTKTGDVEINPGPTTSNNRVWICDICHK